MTTPNDIPDWTGQNKVNLIGGVSNFVLGDTGAVVQVADQGQESAALNQLISSSGMVLASFKPLTTPALVKAGSVATGSINSVSPLFGQAPVAGSLLVAVVSGGGGDPTTAASGWSQISPAGSGGATHITIWAKPNASPPETAPVFTCTGQISISMQAVLLEFSGVVTASPADQSAVLFQAGASTSLLLNNPAVDSVGQDLLVMGCFWRTSTAASVGTFAEAFNNGATATRAADNGSTSQLDHLVASFTVLPALPVSLPVGEATWDYDSTLNSIPGTGNQASVVFPATAGKAWHLAHISAGWVQVSGAATFHLVEVLDGAGAIWERAVALTAAVSDKDGFDLSGLSIKGTVGNSMTVHFTAATAGTYQSISAGAYQR